MKKLSVTKILLIVSIVIVDLGIITGIGVSNSIENLTQNGNLYLDGSDFSGFIQIFGLFGSMIIGVLIVVGSFVIDVLIWLIYGIVLLIISLIKKISKK